MLTDGFTIQTSVICRNSRSVNPKCPIGGSLIKEMLQKRAYFPYRGIAWIDTLLTTPTSKQFPLPTIHFLCRHPDITLDCVDNCIRKVRLSELFALSFHAMSLNIPGFWCHTWPSHCCRRSGSTATCIGMSIRRSRSRGSQDLQGQ